MQRASASGILEDLRTKIVLLTGPRQAGKTTLARSLDETAEYFNYDLAEHRVRLQQKSWDRTAQLVIFDELHKRRDWKAWIKGIYDTEGVPPALLVTGSARLDTHRRVGDSLAGRYFRHRLHPLDLAELQGTLDSEIEIEEGLDRLMTVGGFPEPFLRGERRFYQRWRQTHLDIILRQDLVDLVSVRDIRSIETLVELLKHRVGSPISYASLARELERDPKSVKSWLELLENLYVIFRVAPYHRNIGRALLKEPKYYFFDIAAPEVADAVRFENLVACALLKECERLEDQEGERMRLWYVRTKDGKEVDFLVTQADRPSQLIEVKWAETGLSPQLHAIGRFLPEAKRLQVVRHLRGGNRSFPDGSLVKEAGPWLRQLSSGELLAPGS